MFKLIVFIGSWLILVHCQQKPEPTSVVPISQNSSILSVKMAPVESMNESGQIQALGLITNKAEARPAFKTGGVIAQTNFKEGDRVKRGQVLATLLMTEINAQVNQAEQGLQKAERDAQRVNNLYVDSVATLEQKQNAETALVVARNTLTMAKFNQTHSTVISPIQGTIIKQVMHAGEVAGPGMPVYVIMGNEQADWRVKTGLLDYEWAQVKLNQAAEITFDAYPGQKFMARVTDKSTLVSNASGKLDIELTMQNTPPALAAGMLCKVALSSTGGASLQVIPVDALVKADGEHAEVFIVNEQSQAKKIPITIQKIMGEKVAVKSGLQGVAQVVTIGTMYLEDGDRVQIAN